jgi:hypothetical protein
MVGHSLIPPAERLPGRFLDHGLLVIASGKPRTTSTPVNHVMEVNS